MKRFLFFCLFLACPGGLFAQQAPWYNVNEINAEKPGSIYRFSFIHITDTHIGEGIGDYGTPGVDDEPPAGDVGYSAERLRTFVNWVNANYITEDIAFVIVSGDLTDSGERSEFLKFREIMDALEIPYIPLIGNHDVWPYVDGFVAGHPYGDSLINTIFVDAFEAARAFFDDWDDGMRLTSTWNEEAGRYNYLQNFRATYQGFHFLFMDFDPRYPAGNNEPGIGPEAQIMNFDGGTWPWVEAQLEALNGLGDQNVFLISHHPPAMELWSEINAFAPDEREVIMDFLFGFKNHLAVWLAGHIHRNKTYMTKTSGFSPFNVILCAETEANKEIEQSAFRVLRVYESSIPTSVTDHMLSLGLDLYPNPGSGLFHIYLRDNHDKYLQASMYDATGRKMGDFRLEMLGSTYTFELDLRGWPAGVYHLQLSNGERQLTQNIILQ